MKVYEKKHTDFNVMEAHIAKIEKRGGQWKNMGFKLTYWFPKENPLAVKKDKGIKINIPALNASNKKEIKNWVAEDYDNDLHLINRWVAMKLFHEIARVLKVAQQEIDWVNESKRPDNHFQMNMYTGDKTGEKIIWGAFVYVDGKHNIVENKTDVELLDGDFELIKKLI